MSTELAPSQENHKPVQSEQTSTDRPQSQLSEASRKALAQVILTGDLSKLTDNQKLEHYKTMCDRIGVDFTTNPFDYTRLNGKLVLYAKKGCTDQLRHNRQLSMSIIDRRQDQDIYIVTVRISGIGDRVDEEEGAVALTDKNGKPLKGEARANAIMKCISKAKRRATISYLGLGMLDELEVADIPGAEQVKVEVTEVKPASKPAPLPKATKPTDQPDQTPDAVAEPPKQIEPSNTVKADTEDDAFANVEEQPEVREREPGDDDMDDFDPEDPERCITGDEKTQLIEALHLSRS